MDMDSPTMPCPLSTPRNNPTVADAILPIDEAAMRFGISTYLDEPLAGTGIDDSRFQSFRPTEICAFSYSDPPTEFLRNLCEEGPLHVLFWYDEKSKSFGVCTISTESVTKPHIRTKTLLQNIPGPCQISMSPNGHQVIFLQQKSKSSKGTGLLWAFHIDSGTVDVLANGLQNPWGLFVSPTNEIFWVEGSSAESQIRMLKEKDDSSQLFFVQSPLTLLIVDPSFLGRVEHILVLSDQTLLVCFRSTNSGSSTLSTYRPVESGRIGQCASFEAWTHLEYPSFTSRYDPHLFDIIVEGLAPIRRMVTCPRTGDVLLAACGAAEQNGVPISLFRLFSKKLSPFIPRDELGTEISMVRTQATELTGPPSSNFSASISVDSVFNGFASSVTVDRQGNVFLCPARGGGLRAFWHHGNPRWKALLLKQAIHCPLPDSPHTSLSVSELPNEEVTEQNSPSQPYEPSQDVQNQVASDCEMEEYNPLFLDQPLQLHPDHSCFRSRPLEDASSSVAVVLRARPMLPHETEKELPVAVHCSMENQEVSISGKDRRFRFARVYDETTTQRRVFVEAVAPLVKKVLDGFQCTCFAYGPTGSGKVVQYPCPIDSNVMLFQTFTMEGGQSVDVRNQGMISRAVLALFQALEKPSLKSRVSVSHLEVYNEELYDLLEQANAKPKSQTKRTDPCLDLTSVPFSHHHLSRPIKLLEDRHTHRLDVKGLTEVEVVSPDEIFTILERSSQARFTAETLLNRHSSRSHAIFTINVETEEVEDAGDAETSEFQRTFIRKKGKLMLVDLCGSENIERSGSVGQRAREASHIGQSLLVLGRVIRAIVKKEPYIPYRDSKLTRLLSPALGGHSFCTMILNVAPGLNQREETMNTLKYAELAQGVVLNPVANVEKIRMHGETVEARPDPSTSAIQCDQQKEAMLFPVCPWAATVPISKKGQLRFQEPLDREPAESLFSCIVERDGMPLNGADVAEFKAREQPPLSNCDHSRPATGTPNPLIPLAKRRSIKFARHPSKTVPVPFSKELTDWANENVLPRNHDHAPVLSRQSNRFLSYHATRALKEIFQRFDEDQDLTLTFKETFRLAKLWDVGDTPSLKLSSLTKLHKGKSLTFSGLCQFVAWLVSCDPIAVHYLYRSSGYSLSFELVSKARNLRSRRNGSGRARRTGKEPTELAAATNQETSLPRSSGLFDVRSELFKFMEDFDNSSLHSRQEQKPHQTALFCTYNPRHVASHTESHTKSDPEPFVTKPHRESGLHPSENVHNSSLNTVELAGAYKSMASPGNLPLDLQPIWRDVYKHLNE